jgi:hypothetical protein
MAKDGFCVKPGIETASGVKAQRIEKRVGPNILSFQIFLSLFLRRMGTKNGDVVDKIHKPEYKWELRRKTRYGMDRWSKEKRDQQQG